jgi:hypothetical protein
MFCEACEVIVMFHRLSPENQRPGRLSSRSRLFGRVGWFVAFAAGLLAAVLDSQNFALKTTLRLKQTEVELALIESQSLKQQLAAERILAARQIADLTRSNADAGSLTLVLLCPPRTDTTGVAAVIAWQPSTRSGVFSSCQLPPPNPDEGYTLWIEGSNGQRVSAGPIAISPGQTTKVDFKVPQQVDRPVKFVLTRERRGDVSLPSDVIVLIGTP